MQKGYILCSISVLKYVEWPRVQHIECHFYLLWLLLLLLLDGPPVKSRPSPFIAFSLQAPPPPPPPAKSAQSVQPVNTRPHLALECARIVVQERSRTRVSLLARHDQLENMHISPAVLLSMHQFRWDLR